MISYAMVLRTMTLAKGQRRKTCTTTTIEIQPPTPVDIPSNAVVLTRMLVSGPARRPPFQPFPTAFQSLLQKRVVVLNMRC